MVAYRLMDRMLQGRLPEGSRESRLWDGWLESLIILRAFLIHHPVGGKLTSNNVAGSSHDPLQSPAVASGAGVECFEDAGAHFKLPQPSQEEEALMCLLQHCM